MKSRRQFYLLCFIAVAVVLLVLLFASGSVFTGFRNDTESTGTEALTITGDVSLRRSGTNYQLKEGMSLEEGDALFVGRTASCTVRTEGLMTAALDSSSVVQVVRLTEGELTLQVAEGAALFRTEKEAGTITGTLQAGEAFVTPAPDSVLSLEAYSGTWNVNVYAGEADFAYEGAHHRLSAGDHAVLIREKGETAFFLTEITYRELRDFFLTELIADGGLCFDREDLQAVLDSRKALVTGTADTAERMTCTIEISCENAVGKPEAAGLGLPADGKVLEASAVKFSKGETVFDLLERVCKNSGIPYDYNYTVAYEGYYIFEMSGLSENDFGPASGWLYSINGWYPNFSSSRYEVNEGDVIRWVYTCDGGKDVGRDDWMDIMPE